MSEKTRLQPAESSFIALLTWERRIEIGRILLVGLVSLPGMMTGQILAGADPLQAVKYQIVVMFMVAASATFGCVLIALLAFQKLFTAQHQLAAQLIEKRP